MIRLSRLADYAVVLMSHIAANERNLHNALDIAATTGLPVPTVSKILSALARSGLLVSYRGAKGGYELARPAALISAAEIISSVDGPIALTECIDGAPGDCEYEPFCPARRNWQLINGAVRRALTEVTLADLSQPFPNFEDSAGTFAAAPVPKSASGA
jgi:FeS assembly SUF system regulator